VNLSLHILLPLILLPFIPTLAYIPSQRFSIRWLWRQPPGGPQIRPLDHLIITETGSDRVPGPCFFGPRIFSTLSQQHSAPNFNKKSFFQVEKDKKGRDLHYLPTKYREYPIPCLWRGSACTLLFHNQLPHGIPLTLKLQTQDLAGAQLYPTPNR
jgi:hypothetical protein